MFEPAEDAPRVDPLDNENYNLCHSCGGLCCALYLAHDENGEYIGDEWLFAYIDEWFGKFVESGALVRVGDGYVPGLAGVEPLHDPRLSHSQTPEGEAYLASLPFWVDVRKCQFCHPDTGCLLPGEFRAPICHSYHCELWPDEWLPEKG